MKKITITKASAQTRVANLIVSKVKGAVSFFSYPPSVKISKALSCDMYKVIQVRNNDTRYLTFAEIDEVRAVVDKFVKKYHGIGYGIDSTSYLTKDGEILHQPVMEITIKKYDEDIFNK